MDLKKPLLLAALLFAATGGQAQAAGHPPELEAKAVAADVFVVEGGTANAGFVIGPDGVLVIDAQRSPSEGEAQVALIARHTAKPVVDVVVTHGDPDHVGGLPAYPSDARIIMQENVRAQIRAAAAAGDGGSFFGPMYKELAAGHMPGLTVAASERLMLAGIPVELIHIAPAHSSGDLLVYLSDRKIVFGGDIVQTDQGPFPVIHIGGSSLGWIKSMRAILALDADVIVPGHGPIVSREVLETKLRLAQERRTAIKRMVEAGRAFEEIDAALPPEIGNPMFPSFNRTTYDELVKGYPEQVPPWDSLIEKP